MKYNEALAKATILGGDLNLYVAEGKRGNGFIVISLFKQIGSKAFTKDFYSFIINLEDDALYFSTSYTSDHHYEENIVMADYAVHIIYEA